MSNPTPILMTCGSVCVHVVAVVFKLHAEELRAKQGELEKKNDEIQVLKAIIDTLRQDKPGKRPS